MSCDAGSLYVCLLCTNRFVCEPTLASSQRSDTRSDLVIDPVVEAWDRWEQRWFQGLAVLGKLERIALEITNFASKNAGQIQKHLLKRMRVWKIAYKGLFTIQGQVVQDSGG